MAGRPAVALSLRYWRLHAACIRIRRQTTLISLHARLPFTSRPGNSRPSHGTIETDTDNFFKGPSEDYGNDEHTTVAAFLPWRGS
jgi:hypothetical protein